MHRVRAVIDTNVFIAGALNDGPCATILDLWERGVIIAIFSEATKEELLRTTPRFATRIPPEAIERILEGVTESGVLVEPEKRIRQSRDSDDDKFIEAYVAGEAEYLITGDKDLLVLGDQYRIVSPSEFLTMYHNAHK